MQELTPPHRQSSRHEHKITVYMTAEQVLQLDASLLEMRRVCGVKVDRSRYVREALAHTSFRTVAQRVREADAER